MRGHVASPVKNPTRYKSKRYVLKHVFLQRIAIAPPLTAPYDGSYKVVARSGRVFKVLIKGKVETVTADRVKPAHIEGTPENEQTRQRPRCQKLWLNGIRRKFTNLRWPW